MTVSEALALVGLSTTLIGQATSLGGLKDDWSDMLKLVGLALFFAGIVVTLKDLTRALTELRGAKELTDHKSALDDALHWARHASPPRWHIAAAGDVLRTLLTDYVPTTTRHLCEARTRPQSTFHFDDHSPIHELMYRLAESIPSGSVWFGITHLEQKSAWDLPEADEFSRFMDKIRSRAEKKEIKVLRLYYFHSEEAREQMHELMFEETGYGLDVRYIEEGRQPPDISLIWIPRRSRSAAVASGPNGNGILSTVHAESYVPLCALEYTTRGGMLLTKLSVYSGESREFDDLARVFRQFWAEAKELPALPQDSGELAAQA
jgi:hypothetical protein